MLKWVYLIIVLILGGMLYYNLVLNKSAPPNTPQATAQDLMNAILKNDLTTAKSLFIPDALGNLDSVIKRVQSLNPDPISIQYNKMNAKPPNQGILVVFTGNMIAIELVKENGKWKIVNIGLN